MPRRETPPAVENTRGPTSTGNARKTNTAKTVRPCTYTPDGARDSSEQADGDKYAIPYILQYTVEDRGKGQQSTPSGQRRKQDTD